MANQKETIQTYLIGQQDFKTFRADIFKRIHTISRFFRDPISRVNMNLRFQFIHIVFPLLAILILCGTVSCRRSTPRYRIGVAQCSGDAWRVKTNEELKREAALRENVDIEIRSADNDTRRQLEDIQYFINNGFDLIILSPNDSKELSAAAAEALAKGIKVVTFDRRLEGENFTAHVEVDNYKLGVAAAKYIHDNLPRPVKILELRGPSTASAANRRHDGFADRIATYPEAHVAASVFADWQDTAAAILTDSIITLHPEINVVFAHTDHMGIGAANRLRQLGRKDVTVIGIDGFSEVGLPAVRDSLLTATFLYPTEGERLINTALAVLEGHPYERIAEVEPLPPVTRSNVRTVIEQDAMIAHQTEKINTLHEKLTSFLGRYNTQRHYLIASVLMLCLLAGMLFLLLRMFHTIRSSRKELMEKNALLEEEQEKQKMLYRQLQEATQSKLTFFTNISHDLRTPLTLIAGPVEEMASDNSLEGRNRDLMQMVRKNVIVLRKLIDQILDFRKYENGKAELSLSIADLSILLREWTTAFADVAGRKNITLVYSIPPEKSVVLRLDLGKLQRIFFNLMSNAFKHTGPGGTITVELRKEGDMAVFSVTDTGEGISPEDIDRIFDRFFQGGQQSGKGFGIGLALTKAFVELHGGNLSVESVLGKGSCFKVSLPMNPEVGEIMDTGTSAIPVIPPEEIEAESMPAELPTTGSSDEKPLLLVIDDNPDIRAYIRVLLGDSYNIAEAENGEEGLKMAVESVPDLIVCDVMMPVMDGLECVRQLKQQTGTSHIPVIMLTACALDRQRAEGYSCGADAYLSKPFSGEVLRARCRNLLDNRRRLQLFYSSRGASAGPGNESNRNDVLFPVEQSAVLRASPVEMDFQSRFLDMVDRRLSDSELSVEELAGQLGLSRSQFTRKIKALTGYAPVEIIRRRRLREARRLLLSTDMTVSEAAYRVGFSSLSYFSKCYKEEFDCLPSETRPS